MRCRFISLSIRVGFITSLLFFRCGETVLGQSPPGADASQDKVLEKLIQEAAEKAKREVGRDAPIPAQNEVAMSPGMKITATTPKGTIVITAGNGLKRSYTWEGATRFVEMTPRRERWYGSLGLYFPGPGNHWAKHNGITRGVVEEGQMLFKTNDEAVKWITNQYMPFVYRSDGLAVGWDTNLERQQLSVDVWQLIVDGKKPTALPGGQDDKIVVELPAKGLGAPKESQK
ncbi:MAG TPA: hypothetical protein VGI40_11100 [Pirellulaceae bacterium]|jgi:hypothetical protein